MNRNHVLGVLAACAGLAFSSAGAIAADGCNCAAQPQALNKGAPPAWATAGDESGGAQNLRASTQQPSRAQAATAPPHDTPPSATDDSAQTPAPRRPNGTL